jgi:hypothetical protein
VAEEVVVEEVAVEVDMKPNRGGNQVLLQAQSPTGTIQKNTGPFLLKTCHSYLRSGMLETPREVSSCDYCSTGTCDNQLTAIQDPPAKGGDPRWCR